MSRRLRVLVALATVAAMLLSLAGFASAQFEDVDEDAAYADDVEFLYELGITTGISATEFGPDQTLTRAERVLANLDRWRAPGLPSPT